MAMLSTMTETEKDALGDKIMSKLMELYADQMGVTIEYRIERKEDDHGNLHGAAAGRNSVRRNGVA